MMPARFVELPALPLTSYGKVDRAELRTREIGPSTETEAYVAPRTATEERLAQIVAPLLKRDRVSVDGDFFKIGGHSLLGTQLIARVRDTFGVRMSLRFLFESPTIAALAAEIDRLSLERLGGGGNSLQRR
jgi:acyl carrier protein